MHTITNGDKHTHKNIHTHPQKLQKVVHVRAERALFVSPLYL